MARSNHLDAPGGKRAMVLVLVLWTLVVLAVLAVGLVQTTKVDSAVRVAAGDRVRARWLARAGVHQAIAVLTQDVGPTDWVGRSWYQDDALFAGHVLSDGAFEVCSDRLDSAGGCVHGVTDEASKLNVHTVGREALLALPNVTEQLADAIIAWRSNATVGVGHSEQAAPQVAATTASASGSAGLGTLRELALIDGITAELLYGEDTNLNGILENNENDGDQLPPRDNQDGVLDRGLLAYVTIYSYDLNRDARKRPRLNINTANEVELEEHLGLTINYAKWIVENQATGYANIADLLDDGDIISAATQPKTEAKPQLKVKTLTAEQKKAVASMRPDIAVFRQIADMITVTDAEVIPGRININTASQAVLQTLPGVTEQLAQRIVSHRFTLADGFTSVAELLTVPDITVVRFKLLAGLITVRSNVFTIRSWGSADRTGLRHTVEAVVDRTDDGPSIVYWKESR